MQLRGHTTVRLYALLLELLRLALLLRASGNRSASFGFKQCLRDLSLTELLRLRKSLNGNIADEDFESRRPALLQTQAGVEKPDERCAAEDNCERPLALALIVDGKDRGGYSKPVPTYHHYHHPWQPDEKPSKLQTLFQISITALAFLSFGGYLLCLIVQAIKSKGTTYFHPVATATTTLLNGNGVKRIKIYRRSRRWTGVARPHFQRERINVA